MEIDLKQIKKVKTGATNWITSADQKATGTLILISILLPLFFSLVEDSIRISEAGSCMLVFGALFFLGVMGMLASSLYVIWPRTNRGKLIEHENPLDKSVSFFGDIAEMSYQEFTDAVTKPQDAEGDEKKNNDQHDRGHDSFSRQLRDDIEQAKLLSKIADIKMCGVKWIICSAACAFLGFSVFALILIW